MRQSGFAITLLLACSATAIAGDWTRFRGPNGTGVSTDDKAVPASWSPTENLKWKVELPGSGVSSPIVVGDRVFVTCYSGYGLDRANPGELENLKRHLVCVAAESGDVMWTKTIDAVLPEDPYSGIGVTAHGYASHTPVSDGERVYAFFGKTGAIAFDLDGNQLWQTNVGKESDPWAWGSSSSPIVHDNVLIVTASAESQAIVGLDVSTGEELWRQEAEGFDGVWGTPALAELADGTTEIILSVPGEVWGLNPLNGKMRWYATAGGGEQAHTSPVVADGMIYTVAGRGGGSAAVRAGGKGNATDSSVVWTGNDSGSFGTSVVHEGRLYLIASNVLTVVNAQSGERISQSRLPGAGGGEGGGRESGGGGRGGGGFGRAMDYSSPIIANDKLFYVKGNGETHVFEAGDEPKSVSINRVTEDSESFGGTPAVSDGRLYIRSDKHLYCIASE